MTCMTGIKGTLGIWFAIAWQYTRLNGREEYMWMIAGNIAGN